MRFRKAILAGQVTWWRRILLRLRGYRLAMVIKDQTGATARIYKVRHRLNGSLEVTGFYMQSHERLDICWIKPQEGQHE